MPGCACGCGGPPFGKNFFFFFRPCPPCCWPWPCCGRGAAVACGWLCAGCVCACCGCAAPGWLDLFLRRRRRRRCPCDWPWPTTGLAPASGWGCVESVVMRALPGTLLLDALLFHLPRPCCARLYHARVGPISGREPPLDRRGIGRLIALRNAVRNVPRPSFRAASRQCLTCAEPSLSMSLALPAAPSLFPLSSSAFRFQYSLPPR